MEGTRLSLMNHADMGRSIKDSFTKYFMKFAKRHNFIIAMTPFSSQNYGPEWFRREFPPLAIEHETQVIKIWEAFLTPRLLPSRLGNTKDTMILVSYQPNLISRYFGFSQLLPRSYYNHKNDIYLCTIKMNEAEYIGRLH